MLGLQDNQPMMLLEWFAPASQTLGPRDSWIHGARGQAPGLTVPRLEEHDLLDILSLRIHPNKRLLRNQGANNKG